MKAFKNILLGFFALAFLAMLNHSCNKAAEYSDLIGAHGAEVKLLNDSLVRYKNKYGNEVAEKQAIALSYKSLKNDVASKDRFINELQSQLTKHTAAETVAEIQTEVKNTTSVDIIKKDSVRHITHYDFHFKDSIWAEATEKVTIPDTGKPSIQRDLKFTNHFLVEDEYRKKSLLSKPDLYVKVTNKNPYTTTTEAQSFLIKKKKTKLEKALGIGRDVLFFLGGLFIGTKI